MELGECTEAWERRDVRAEGKEDGREGKADKEDSGK